MKSVAKVRREVGVKSLFNLVGPLSNPTRAGRQIVGVYSKDLVEPLAKVLHNLGLVRAFVVHGLEGLDEVSIVGETLVGEVSPEGVKVYTITPEEVGLKRRTLEEIKGGDCTYNVQIFEQILEGKNEAAEDFLVINSAFALTAAGVVDNPKEGVELAREVIRNGKVANKVEEFVRLSGNI
jgi:anthranilate phosphoribosyltransferase